MLLRFHHWQRTALPKKPKRGQLYHSYFHPLTTRKATSTIARTSARTTSSILLFASSFTAALLTGIPQKAVFLTHTHSIPTLRLPSPYFLSPYNLPKNNMSFSSSPSPTEPSLQPPIEPQIDSFVVNNLLQVRERIQQCISNLPSSDTRPTTHTNTQERHPSQPQVRLVAVSKMKPIEMLLEAYHLGGQRHFGENYVQELIDKAQQMPKDIHWHFIGPLQSNKASRLVKSVGLDQLACVESVDSIKLARKLNQAVESLLNATGRDYDPTSTDTITNASTSTSKSGTLLTLPSSASAPVRKLNIFLQINTSQEDTKSGVETREDAVTLAQEIVQSCPYLHIQGLMTIGAPGDCTCFDTLASYRSHIAQALQIQDEGMLELSMGMSGDFEEAIRRGATSVRVGSTIFGGR